MTITIEHLAEVAIDGLIRGFFQYIGSKIIPKLLEKGNNILNNQAQRVVTSIWTVYIDTQVTEAEQLKATLKSSTVPPIVRKISARTINGRRSRSTESLERSRCRIPPEQIAPSSDVLGLLNGNIGQERGCARNR